MQLNLSVVLLFHILTIGFCLSTFLFKNQYTHLHSICFAPAIKLTALKAEVSSGGLITKRSTEEKISLDIGIKSCSFLKNIVEYGNNRMARRAVGVIQKMPTYKVYPTEVHYNAGLWACENSMQFQLALSLCMEMKDFDIHFTENSYEALISVSEKTGHNVECLDFFWEMRSKNIKGNTAIFNNCMWACVKDGNSTLSLDLLQTMEVENIPRDVTTYAACISACKTASEGVKALHVLDLMKLEGIAMNTPTHNAAMWACLNSDMSQESISLFESMESENEDETIARDADSFNAVIWACAVAEDSKRAVEYLRQMKLSGLKRETKSFDGVFLALSRTGSWETLLDVLVWMDRDGLSRSSFTYRTAIDALDNANREDEAMLLYVRAMREELLSPWLKASRTIDMRGITISIAKITMKNILVSMKNRKMSPFMISILLGDDVESGASFDVNLLQEFLLSLEPCNVLILESFEENGSSKLKLSRERILQWMEGWAPLGSND